MGIVTIVWFGMMFSDGNKKNNWLAETLESWLNQTAATYSSGTASGTGPGNVIHRSVVALTDQKLTPFSPG